mmetsp:Transcript_22862/g.45730  ORF Transcript_22862/g.45730 Transcript_22862/m.45730 type:complete len:844 (+) Transcript_22862:75-2606(+)|eukprot:CAMPEP_0194306768 /NCGR_PEP_ID=MMETSP0171-20130528/3789_1 /TAXON_ID=218684 /ORGANISM="Corethron pennatum, Strain L29A3" /LENGTH=843 /DNA_ID=CAMNT_0039058609 /DNA_START=75 /DNA_END=2606 /DNA_ORIENTATION=+
MSGYIDIARILVSVAPVLTVIRISVDVISRASQKSRDEQAADTARSSGNAPRPPDGNKHGDLTEPLLPHPEDEENSDVIHNVQSSSTIVTFLKIFYPLLSLLYALPLFLQFPLYHLSSLFNRAVVISLLLHNTINTVLIIMDSRGERYGKFQRSVHCLSIVLMLPVIVAAWVQIGASTEADVIVIASAATTHAVLNVAEIFLRPRPRNPVKDVTVLPSTIWHMLVPYIWPSGKHPNAAGNRLRCISTFFCVVLNKACNVISPLYLGKASSALHSSDYPKSVKFAVFYVLMQFLGKVTKEAQGLVYLKVAQAGFVELSTKVFAHLHGLSLEWHIKKKLGEVLRSMDRGISACDTLMKYLFLWLLPAMLECLAVIIIFGFHFNYPPLAITVFGFVYLYVFWTILVTTWRKKFRKAVTRSDNDWHNLCTDSLTNFETVKFFGAEEHEVKRFEESVHTYQSKSVRVQASLSFLNITQQILLQGCLLTALILAVYGIKKRDNCCLKNFMECEAGAEEKLCCPQTDCPGMNIGDFVAVFTYILQLFFPLNFLGTVYNAVVMALIDLANLSDILQEKPDVADAPDSLDLPTHPAEDNIAVKFDNVSFHYPTQPPQSGLHDISFTMKKGTVTAIVGPTGGGKTTISRLLFRLYDVVGGAVKVHGTDVRVLSQKSLRSSLGVVPQQASLFNDTLRKNILYGRFDATQEDLEKVAAEAQLDTFINSLPLKWEALVGDRGLKLSGGEKQRVAIARCLLKDPSIVLLDEATSALDTLTENSVQMALNKLGKERTCLVIAHRLGTIKDADNIIVVAGGRVVEQGTHVDLLKTGGMYAEMWNMQIDSKEGSKLDLLA